ncbi:MAG: deaminase [Campylobacteraceae bacterium 4484_166]|nr:MAG: deaminase [Campylobacteraceae bacterium 4484_166]
MEFLHTDNAPKAIGPYSQAVKNDGLLYSSGQIALDTKGNIVSSGIKEQTRQVLKNIKAILEDNESCKENVIKVNIYLDNMDDFGIVNVIYADFFGEHKPARSTVAVQTLPKNVLIEMDIIAKVSDYH